MEKKYVQPEVAVMQYTQTEKISAVTWNDQISGEHNDTNI